MSNSPPGRDTPRFLLGVAVALNFGLVCLTAAIGPASADKDPPEALAVLERPALL